MPQDIINSAISTISNEEWQTILKKLFLYARIRIVRTRAGRIKIIKGILANRLPNEELDAMAEDLVQEAISKLLARVRNTWNPQPPIVDSLLKYLKEVIDSLANTEVTRVDNRILISERSLNQNVDDENDTAVEIADDSPNFEEQVLIEEFKRFLKKGGEVIGYNIVELGQIGIFKRADLAEQIGCSTTDITNAKKRLTKLYSNFVNNTSNKKEDKNS